MANYARRTWLKLLYNKKDISEDIARYLKSFSFNDVMSGAADDISIELENINNFWGNDWFPEKGALLTTSILKQYWDAEDEQIQERPLGLFELDEIELSGKPSIVSIKGVSVPDNTALRGVDKTRSWEKTKLSVIATDIAVGAGMTLFYDTEDDPKLDRAEQTEQSDLSFLQGLCNNAGLALKISNNQIIIFDEAKFEQAEAVGKISESSSLVLSYNFKTSTRGTYAACRIKYQNGTKKTKFDYTYKLPGKTGKTLQINEEVNSIGEAEILARKKLREANKNEVTANISIAGGFEYCAGSVYELEAYGKFDGRYIIVRASHSIGSGYTVGLEMRRCLDGY